MFLRLLNFLAGRLPYFLIQNCNGAPYILRVSLLGRLPGQRQRFPLGVYLHRIYRPDQDRHIHNHPWRWAFSILLAGGYTEERATAEDLRRGHGVRLRWLRPWRLNFLGRDTFHRIRELHGPQVWTLMIVWDKCEDWGFLVGSKVLVSHEEYWTLRERGVIREDRP